MSEDPIKNNQGLNDQLLASELENIFGLRCWDDSSMDTARRVLKYWREFAGEEEPSFKFTTFPAAANQMILVRDIEFTSLCAHHLLPFYGVAHVAYLPNKLMVGLSKIPRLVDFYAKRPQTQEKLTREIASYLKQHLEAQGVAVIMESKHTCMCCRGVEKVDASMTTSEMRGVFLTSGEARNEFLTLVTHGR